MSCKFKTVKTLLLHAHWLIYWVDLQPSFPFNTNTQHESGPP